MKRLTVKLHGERIATISGYDDEFETHDFAPERAWLRRPQHPVLGKMWEDRGPRPLTTHGLTPWFEHILPRGQLRRAIAREAKIDEGDGLSLLSWLSDDLLGAVTAEIAPDLPYVLSPNPLMVAGEEARYRCSLPGNQWKLSLAEGSSGYTLPARGEDAAWIAKVPSGDCPRLVEVEAATMAWAAASGVVVPEVREESIDHLGALPDDLHCPEGKVYLIRRFDRSPAGRVHCEDFGQILDTPPGPRQFASHYEHIAAVLVRLCPPADLRAFVRQLVFCILAGNCDAHTKNWSVLYPDQRHARLSPAYDLVATIVYPQFDKELALHLAGHKALTPLECTRFEPMARATRLDLKVLWSWVCEDVESTLRAWGDPDVYERFTRFERKRICDHLGRCAGKGFLANTP